MGVQAVSTWINKENALAAYKGLVLNRYWASWVGWNNHPIYRCEVSFSPYAAWTIYQLGKGLFATFNDVKQTLSPERVTSYGGNYVPLVFIALNAAKVFKDYSSVPVKDNPLPTQPAKEGIMDKVLVTIWKATPYLMIMTNIAMTSIQIQKGDSTACVTLAFAGITLIDLTNLRMSTHYLWYRNVVLEGSVAAVALYYSNNTNRLNIIHYSAPTIITEIVLKSQTLYQVMREPLVEALEFFLTELQNNLELIPAESRVKAQQGITTVRSELAKNAKESSFLEMMTRISTNIKKEMKKQEQKQKTLSKYTQMT